MEYKLSSEVGPLPLILYSSWSMQLREYLCVKTCIYVCMKVPREKCEGGGTEAGRAATRVYKTGTQLRDHCRCWVALLDMDPLLVIICKGISV